jgi:hypothetical protein
MRIKFNIYLLFAVSLTIFVLGCKDHQSRKGIAVESAIVSPNPIIGRRVITDEIAGSAYRKKAMGYFVVDKGDTSSLMFVFSEAKESEKINLLFRESERRRAITYRQKLEQLKKILPEAAKDFKIDSLDAVSIGRLIFNGDIAVELTEEFLKSGNPQLDNYHLALFMKDSRLAKDMNEVFSGYSIRVNGFSLEKTHFSSKEVLLRVSSIERDSTTIPEKIIDCQTWISFKSSR